MKKLLALLIGVPLVALFAEHAPKVEVSVSAYRVPRPELEKLGGAWLLGKESAGSPRLAGLLLPHQNAILQRALEAAAGGERKEPRATRKEDRWTLTSPWNPDETFHLGIEPEPDGAGVTWGNSSVFISKSDGNVLAFSRTDRDVAEIWFVAITIRRPPESLPATPGKPLTEIATTIVQIPEAGFLEHATALDEAIKTGDPAQLEPFRRDGQLVMVESPRVSVRNGERATISLVREYQFPAGFLRGPDGTLAADAFERTNLGVEVEIECQPASEDEDVRLQGKPLLRAFEGMTRSESGVFLPEFQTTEAYFSSNVSDARALEPGCPACGRFGFPATKTSWKS